MKREFMTKDNIDQKVFIKFANTNYVFLVWWLVVKRKMWHWDLQTKKHYQVDLNRPWEWLIIIKI